ncbi:MAG: hypothetical protein JWQ38_2949 [Flavipsychrobacter sp.]|nr:hypothetical protein [Flavipsychrobacter sp.]
MRRSLIVLLFSIFYLGANGQSIDSLFVIRKGNNWAIQYIVKPGENVHMLAQRFYLTDRVLETANEYGPGKKLTPGGIIEIPVIADNYFRVKQSIDNSTQREIYYHVGSKDDIAIISTYAGVTKVEMRRWNNLKGNTLTVNEVLFVGWIKVMAFDTLDPVSLAAYPPIRKAPVVKSVVQEKVLGGLDSIYNRQTNDGMNVLTEKGTAVFFEKAGKSNMYVAFHNASPRGSIIKVSNPGNGKFIYVKVLGPVPDTKVYANCIIGICSAAKEALGVTDTKAWCELSYAAN